MTCGTASSYSLPSCPKDSNHLSRWGGLSASKQSCHSDARNATKGDTSTMDLEITLRVNGATYQLSVDTRTTLLDALRGAPATGEVFGRAAEAELAEAQPLPGNAFKVPLARNTLVRTLLDLTGEGV